MRSPANGNIAGPRRGYPDHRCRRSFAECIRVGCERDAYAGEATGYDTSGGQEDALTADFVSARVSRKRRPLAQSAPGDLFGEGESRKIRMRQRTFAVPGRFRMVARNAGGSNTRSGAYGTADELQGMAAHPGLLSLHFQEQGSVRRRSRVQPRRLPHFASRRHEGARESGRCRNRLRLCHHDRRLGKQRSTTRRVVRA